MLWKEIPIIRVLIPFIAGIVLTINMRWYLDGMQWVILGVAFLLVALTVWRPLGVSRKLDRVSGFFFMSLFVLLGMWLTERNTQILSPDHFGHYLDSSSHALVRITDPPVEKARSFKIEVDVERLVQGDSQISVMGKALLYLPKGEDVKRLKYGDMLLVANRFREINPPMNPGQFNYKRYLSFHNIYHQAYVPEEQWSPVGVNTGKWLWKNVLGIREYLLSFIGTEFAGSREKGVASALLLGYRDLLDDETIRAYSSTGAMHVLAVSGLHVGIIFFVLNWMLGFLNHTTRLRQFVKFPILLIGIWFYASLTGLSPSVQRAAVMFSFIVAGQAMNRTGNIFSSICGSALFLLAIDPFLITEIGFLLSYSAVIGIVIIQPRLYRTLYVRNRLLDWAWQLSCVSIAAQIATFPVGLLYFHQFPTFFLFSNLVVIPAAAIILYVGVTMFVLSPFALVGSFLANALESVIWLLNEIIAFIDRLPASLITGIYISRVETLLLYGMIIGTMAFLIMRRTVALRLALMLGALMTISIIVRRSEAATHDLFVVYHVQNHSAMNMISGRHATITADSLILYDPNKMLFNIEHHLWELGIRRQVRNSTEDMTDRLHGFAGRSVLVLDRRLPLSEPATPLHVNYVVVSNAPYLNMDNLRKFFRFDKIIFDSSNPPWLTSKWREQCESLGIASHDINNQGAFIAKL